MSLYPKEATEFEKIKFARATARKMLSSIKGRPAYDEFLVRFKEIVKSRDDESVMFSILSGGLHVRHYYEFLYNDIVWYKWSLE